MSRCSGVSFLRGAFADESRSRHLRVSLWDRIMLPAHLQVHRDDDDSSDDDFPRRNKHPSFQARTAPVYSAGHAPPLGLTGVLCDSHNIKVPGRGIIHYTVFRPRQIKYKPPLLCVAGGPLLPCQYLSPLVHIVTDRSVILYDQIGAGLSKLEPGVAGVDIPAMVNDLKCLVDHVPMESFHLYGHSFGGILAFELMKVDLSKQCHSLTLSNTPCSVTEAIEHSESIINDIRQELGEEADVDTVAATFSARHECRVEPLPLTLHQSFEMAGFQSSCAKGLQDVKDYVAQPAHDIPPALLIGGEYDFVDMNHWTDIIEGSKQVKVLKGCSHYGLHENEKLYGDSLREFLQRNDPQLPDIILPNGVRVRR